MTVHGNSKRKMTRAQTDQLRDMLARLAFSQLCSDAKICKVRDDLAAFIANNGHPRKGVY